jgi:mannose-6-phosphate isomerase-like protein (cupin superfamily)
MVKAKNKPSRRKTRVPAKPAGKSAARSGSRARHRKQSTKQHFAVSHHRDATFESGLRRYAKYRDLGISRATNGMVQAHVIRFVPPCRPEEVAKLHYHDVQFQMIYVLKGWIESKFEGHGAITMHAGSCWVQPSGIKHSVLGYSDDCEVLEIVLPADFRTVMLE